MEFNDRVDELVQLTNEFTQAMSKARPKDESHLHEFQLKLLGTRDLTLEQKAVLFAAMALACSYSLAATEMAQHVQAEIKEKAERN